jgi:hypothetical protein
VTHNELAAVVAALEPFVIFTDWFTAACQVSDRDVPKPGDAILQSMEAGGSYRVYWEDFVRTRTLLLSLKERHPDAPCWTSEGGVLPAPELLDPADRPEAGGP